MNDLKTALISGGTSGIGLAAARIFLEHNFNVALVGRNVERGHNAVKSLGDFDRRVFFIAADVSNTVECDRIIDDTVAHFGRLDVLVNSAGLYTEGDIRSVDETLFDRIIAVNVKGTFFMCRAAVDHLSKTRGSIVNVASDAGVKGNYFCSLYSASKGAVIAFTKSLALELAHIPIRVNAVAPGDTLTPMTINQLKRSGETIDELA
ncbi:MAG: SDR family oxidoreductase, partial [Selenomonadaceae bacterium]|nr:SDR family oxidoreductase [Selenomonadaceae bacterium]